MLDRLLQSFDGRSKLQGVLVGLCTLSCLFKSDGVLNALVQVVQAYGRFPMWISSLFFKCDDRVNVLLQVVHEYGRSPVWILS